jgi:glucose-6-phosphate dehydrogenase assembly protein OpcA
VPQQQIARDASGACDLRPFWHAKFASVANSAQSLPKMSAVAESFATGMPVEIGNIGRELKKLWEQGGEKMTRASLINLAVYSEDADSLPANTQIVAELTNEHACRAIVVAADLAAGEHRIEAWIAAHCHVSRAGSKQVCSEQISFALRGALANLPNILFSHLDSDLPFYLWWQGDLPEQIDPQLWSWVDRLIYDSAEWQDFDAQMQRAEAAHAEADERMVLCDLNWTRLVHLRLALAQFFDTPAAQEQLANIGRVEIAVAPGYRSTGILLAGWLAAQLGWTLIEAPDENTIGFCSCAGEMVRVGIEESGSGPVSRCSLLSGADEFRVVELPCGDLLEATIYNDGRQRMQQLMPAGRNEPVALVKQELMRGGRHRVYRRAVSAVRDLL